VIKLITIDGEYRGHRLYHPGLVYEPTEQVMFMATRYAGTFGNSGTAKRYLKVLAAFCRNYSMSMWEASDIQEIIENFERYIHRNHILAWMSARADKRDIDGASSPTDRTIETDAVIVGNYLHWAKGELEKKGVTVPYDGGKLSMRRVRLDKKRNFLAGVRDKIEVERIDHGLHLSRKPTPGTDPQVMAKRSQKNGHSYFKPDELLIFLTSFSDPVWSIAALTAYHTGLRPHELLAVPRYAQYEGDKYFTADPTDLRSLKAKGKDQLIYRCYGKGEKFREVVFCIDDWISTMDLYEPIFRQRREYFERVTGDELAPHLLWLTKPCKNTRKMLQYCLPGDQMNYDKYLQSLRGAVSYATEKHRLTERFGHPVDFYSLRHTFATVTIINMLNADKALREKAEQAPLSILDDINVRLRLTSQLGHDDFETTFRHYIDNVVASKAISFPSVTNIREKLNQLDSRFVPPGTPGGRAHGTLRV